MRARIRKEITVRAEDKVGAFSQLFDIAEAAGVNIRAFHGYVLDGNAVFNIVVDSHAAAAAAFEAAGYPCEVKEVVLVSAGDRVGAAAEIARRLAQCGVDVHASYGSGTVAMGEFQAVLHTSDCSKAADVLDNR